MWVFMLPKSDTPSFRHTSATLVLSAATLAKHSRVCTRYPIPTVCCKHTAPSTDESTKSTPSGIRTPTVLSLNQSPPTSWAKGAKNRCPEGYSKPQPSDPKSDASASWATRAAKHKRAGEGT